MSHHQLPLFFFFNDTATTEIYTLSLHDALPICRRIRPGRRRERSEPRWLPRSVRRERLSGERFPLPQQLQRRSEEHTSELQSLAYLVCRLLLEKKKTRKHDNDDEIRGGSEMAEV